MSKRKNRKPSKKKVRRENKFSDAFRDSIRAARRLYGDGLAK